MRTDPSIRRFFANVSIGDRDECWLWIGRKNQAGYGQLVRGDKWIVAHRYSYEIFKQRIPNGCVVMHLCDNTSCVNPLHLRMGTQADNMKDMRSKGRDNYTGRKTRPTHCKQGHLFTESNTIWHKVRGTRECRICNKTRRQLRRY